MISIHFYWKKTLGVHKFYKCGPSFNLKSKQDKTSHCYTCIEIQALIIFSPNYWEKIFFLYSAYLQLQTCFNVFNNLLNKKLMTFNIIDDSQMTAFYVDKLIYWYLVLFLNIKFQFMSHQHGNSICVRMYIWAFAIAQNVKCLPTADF